MNLENKVIVIAGASGVIGRHIIARALTERMKIRVLSHGGAVSARNDIEVRLWNPDEAATGNKEELLNIAAVLNNGDLIVNLAGVSIGQGRMGSAGKRRILESRINATRALGSALDYTENAPPVWIQASAVGYYGDTSEDDITEESEKGELFLSNVCYEWENVAREKLEKNKIRLIITRFGLVLSQDAPAWKKMFLPIKFGLGSILGDGQQWYSWIDGDDLTNALFFIFENKDANGVYNFTAPEPVRQGDLVREIARKIKRPLFFKIPSFFLRLVTGGIADELLLPSCRALPERLLKTGFKFQRGSLKSELDFLLSK